MARALWLNCALPSILYGCEIIPIDTQTIKEIEKCQSTIGKFILQINNNSANVSSNLDAGLKPIKYVIEEKVLLYNKKITQKSPDSWPKQAYEELLKLGDKSQYIRYLNKIKLSMNTFGLTYNQIKNTVHKGAVRYVLNEKKRTCVSMFATTTPDISKKYAWFKAKTWVDYSETSKIFNEFRCCNTGLGNRGQTKMDGLSSYVHYVTE